MAIAFATQFWLRTILFGSNCSAIKSNIQCLWIVFASKSCYSYYSTQWNYFFQSWCCNIISIQTSKHVTTCFTIRTTASSMYTYLNERRLRLLHWSNHWLESFIIGLGWYIQHITNDFIQRRRYRWSIDLSYCIYLAQSSEWWWFCSRFHFFFLRIHH